MKALMLNPPAADGVKLVREGRCMQRQGAWTAVWAPLSLALSAAVLLEDGHDVILHDCIVEEIELEGVRKILGDFRPDLVLINTVTPSIDYDLAITKVIKEVCPTAFTVAFGIHVTVYPEASLQQYLTLDAVIRGEPELAIRDIARARERNQELTGVAGIHYRAHDQVVGNPDRTPLKSLDELPFPAWQLVQRQLYRMPFLDNPFLLVATGRGCPYQCNFCADPTFYGHKLIVRSPARVVDEMEWVRDSFGIIDFLFWSESFTINPRYARAVAEEIIKRGDTFRWVCNSRVDNVTYDLLKTFQRAGCWMIGYGVEVGSQEILDRMHKGTTLEQARQAVSLAHKAGLEVTGHCVVGYPGETRSTIEQTMKFTIELDLDFAQFYCAVPFPGSELYGTAQAQGWITTKDWTRYEQNFSVLTTPQITAAEVMALRAKAYRRFYLRPRMIGKTIVRIRTRKQLRKFLSMVRDFITWL